VVATVAERTTARDGTRPPGAAGRAPSRRAGVRWLRRVALAVGALFAILVALLTIGQRLLPYHVLPVYTGSMRPAFAPGSAVVVRPLAAADVRVGDVITFTDPRRGEFVTHRVIRRISTASGPAFLTKGDANGVPDSWQVPARGHGWKLWFAVPRIGSVLGRIETPAANLALRGALAAAMSLWILFAVWRANPRQPVSAG